MTVMRDVDRRGAMNGGTWISLSFVLRILVVDWTVAILMVVLLLKGGRTSGNVRVSTDPLMLGGLITDRRRVLVVVTLRVW